MRLAAFCGLLLVAACSDLVNGVGEPPLAETAAKCGLTEATLRQAKKQVAAMPPYQGRRFGACDLIVDSDGGGHVTVITPAVQREVENMTASEKAEAKK